MHKIVIVGGEKYYIQDRADLVALTRQLISKGYSVSQIAKILNTTERTVIRYLQEC